MKTMGMVEVAALAASAEGAPPTVTSTVTLLLTSSVASVGNRSYAPRAQRNSMARFLPSIRPLSLNPLRNAASTFTESSGDRLLINPHRRLLRARRQRPCRHCAAKQRDELAPLHSMTSSAANSNAL